MNKTLFKWFVEIPAAMHTWIVFFGWLLAGGNFAYMAFHGTEVHILIATALVSVGGAALIGNQLPPLLKRWAQVDHFRHVAILIDEMGSLGHSPISIGAAMEAWAEIAQDDKGSVRRHLKLRQIKAWVAENPTWVVALNGTDPNIKTTLKYNELADFFRRGCK